ncbi:hypothetical protein [Lutispora sp.]|uniref:hypothetical protein n=1 Tax=Lutispora sp. TaxID=2828727 RepID=UPI0035638B7D
MCDIDMMPYESIKRYINFRERQVIKCEAILTDEEFKALENRLGKLRKDDYISSVKLAVLTSQIRSMKQWNRENKKNNKCGYMAL